MRFWKLLALAPLLVGAAPDPRPGLVELQMEAKQTAALLRVEQFLLEDSARSQIWGMDYLRGHLLEQAQRAAEAPAAFQTAIEMTPQLADYASFRIALNHYESGRPEAAAEQLANLLAEDPSAPLIPKAAQLLNRALAEGGDCRVLEGWQSWGLDRARTREIKVPLVDCALEAGETGRAMELMVAILRGSREDQVALEAATRLAALFATEMDPPTALRVGLALYHHRNFAAAIPFLESSLEDSTSSTRGLGQVDEADILYALARSHYWQGDYRAAAERFALAADGAAAAMKVARAFFQRGRCLALEGNWDSAVTSYRRAADADPNGSWAAAATLSALRLEWRQGREESALALFEEIRSRGSWRSSLERAALFLAASDLVRGHTARVSAWLDLASYAHRRDSSEIGYWRGRLAERENRPGRALDHYLALAAADPYHPLAQSAMSRWSQGELHDAAQQRALKLSASGSTSDLLHAWLLLPADHPGKTRLRQRLLERLSQSSRNRPFIEMEAIAPADWPLWKQRARRPEDVLLRLGVIETMSTSVRSAFPLQDTALALSGSELLVVNGLHRSSLYSAEVIGRRIPSGLPQAFLPTSFRRLLFPRPYDSTVAHQTSRFGVDADLLTAIIREESRFDPLAVSPAAARGLTQFVLPTALRLSRKLDLGDLHTADLHDPDIAITLGAAYLAELDRFFDGNTSQVVAGYNAGEDLARLWLSYCFSHEPAEYFTKVGYAQTRDYLAKVLSSREQYREIYTQTSNQRRQKAGI